jgi:hypothetical protein
VFKQFIDTFLVFEGKYSLIPSQNNISLSINSSAVKEKDVKLDYYYKDQALFISFKKIDEGVEYVLERQQK